MSKLIKKFLNPSSGIHPSRFIGTVGRNFRLNPELGVYDVYSNDGHLVLRGNPEIGAGTVALPLSTVSTYRARDEYGTPRVTHDFKYIYGDSPELANLNYNMYLKNEAPVGYYLDQTRRAADAMGPLTMLPGTGDVADVVYFLDDLAKGNFGSAALGLGLAALPFATRGMIKQPIRGLNYLRRTDGINRADGINMDAVLRDIKLYDSPRAEVVEFGLSDDIAKRKNKRNRRNQKNADSSNLESVVTDSSNPTNPISEQVQTSAENPSSANATPEPASSQPTPSSNPQGDISPSDNTPAANTPNDTHQANQDVQTPDNTPAAGNTDTPRETPSLEVDTPQEGSGGSESPQRDNPSENKEKKGFINKVRQFPRKAWNSETSVGGLLRGAKKHWLTTTGVVLGNSYLGNMVYSDRVNGDSDKYYHPGLGLMGTIAGDILTGAFNPKHTPKNTNKTGTLNNDSTSVLLGRLTEPVSNGSTSTGPDSVNVDRNYTDSLSIWLIEN